MERTNVAVHLSGVSEFMVLRFLFPAELVFEFARPEEGEEQQRGNVLRLIQIRLMCTGYMDVLRIL